MSGQTDSANPSDPHSETEAGAGSQGFELGKDKGRGDSGGRRISGGGRRGVGGNIDRRDDGWQGDGVDVIAVHVNDVLIAWADKLRRGSLRIGTPMY